MDPLDCAPHPAAGGHSPLSPRGGPGPCPKRIPPEHRTATIAFIQYGGLDDLLLRQGAQGAAGRLDELVRLVQEAAERYDVCFLDSDIASDGGKIRLGAGAPRVVGDDEERMLLALRQIMEADLPLPVQVGVSRGPVFTGGVGPAYRRWYAVMGDTVNLAARVMGKAPAGHIYATRDVQRRVEGRFRQVALEPFAVKGKARPVEAWDVGPPLRSGADVAERPQLPLLGRESELRPPARGGRRRPARLWNAHRAGRRDWQRQISPFGRGAQAGPGHDRAALHVRGGDEGDALFPVARAAAPAARCRMGRPGGARAGTARSRGSRQPAGSAALVAVDRDRSRCARARYDRGGAAGARGSRDQATGGRAPLPQPRA